MMSELKVNENVKNDAETETLAKKAGSLLFKIAMISIFAEILFPPMKYVSMAAFSLSYITNIWREWEQNKKIDPISFILCTLAVACIFAREFVDSKYIVLFGQMITYGFLLRSSYKVLGKVDKGFVALIVCAVSVGVLRILYPSNLTTLLNLGMSIWIIFRFLDPILRKIALDHRAKRLAAAAAREAEKTDEPIIEGE